MPTNASFPDRVLDSIERLTTEFPATELVLNVSLDEVGERHDELRGLPGNWALAMETYRRVRDLQARAKNLTLGIHTVVSKFNVTRLPEICDALLDLDPDSYIAEVAEQRRELRTVGVDITPSAFDWTRAIDHVGARLAARPARRLGRLIGAMRDAYYREVGDLLSTGEEVRPCFAGTAACHVLPDGEVVACGVRGDSLGNLRDVDYSLPALWRSDRARAVRSAIALDHCRCPLANQWYVNVALDPVALVRIGARAAAHALDPSRRAS